MRLPLRLPLPLILQLHLIIDSVALIFGNYIQLQCTQLRSCRSLYEYTNAEKCQKRQLEVPKTPTITSPSGGASINLHIVPSHVATCFAQHEQCHSLVLFWCTDSAEHVVILPLGSIRLAFPEVLLNHGRHNMTRTQSVDPDAARSIWSLSTPLHG